MLLERDIFYLDKVETHRSIVCNTQVGSRAPAYATSAGKAILACQSDDYIDEYCRWMEQAAHPLTANTIIDPGAAGAANWAVARFMGMPW